MKKLLLPALLLSTLNAQADALSRPDAHAPIGVMGEHTHHQGEWMLSYRYMDMKMDGNRSGSHRVSETDVFGTGFLVAPLNMDMRMHMLGTMYAPSNKLTLMAMIPLNEVIMDHQVNPTPPPMMAGIAGRTFETEASGLGDIKLGGLYNLFKGNGKNLIANFSLSIPTGSIDERDVLANPMMGELQMPYPMQLGSGTYDIIPGLTYTELKDNFSWGAQAKATIRLGDNDNDYTLGDRFLLSTWAAKPLNKHISISARLSHDNWEDVDGTDSALNAMLLGFNGGTGAVPTLRSDLRAGKRTDLGLGVNFIFSGKGVANHRIALEIAQPIAQDLDGPQLETDQLLSLGYQVAL